MDKGLELLGNKARKRLKEESSDSRMRKKIRGPHVGEVRLPIQTQRMDSKTSGVQSE
jgi:hypothetical protein